MVFSLQELRYDELVNIFRKVSKHSGIMYNLYEKNSCDKKSLVF